MGYVWRAVKKLVDPMATVSLDDTAVVAFGMAFDDVPRLFESHARLDICYCFVQAFSGRFNNSDSAWVCQCFLPHVICLVEVSMEATVVKADVEVENVTIEEDPLVRYAMADDFIGRSTHRLWKPNIVQW